MGGRAAALPHSGPTKVVTARAGRPRPQSRPPLTEQLHRMATTERCADWSRSPRDGLDWVWPCEPPDVRRSCLPAAPRRSTHRLVSSPTRSSPVRSAVGGSTAMRFQVQPPIGMAPDSTPARGVLRGRSGRDARAHAPPGLPVARRWAAIPKTSCSGRSTWNGSATGPPRSRSTGRHSSSGPAVRVRPPPPPLRVALQARPPLPGPELPQGPAPAPPREGGGPVRRAARSDRDALRRPRRPRAARPPGARQHGGRPPRPGVPGHECPRGRPPSG